MQTSFHLHFHDSLVAILAAGFQVIIDGEKHNIPSNYGALPSNSENNTRKIGTSYTSTGNVSASGQAFFIIQEFHTQRNKQMFEWNVSRRAPEHTSVPENLFPEKYISVLTLIKIQKCMKWISNDQNFPSPCSLSGRGT